MEFDVAAALRKSTGRAKSDVANKLVSMLLHEMSRKACVAGGMAVSDPRYTDSVVTAFGHNCLYCGTNLEKDRSAVEHLNGMNRFQVGLHIPGNVAMACKKCNNEKRRDDQNPILSELGYGWESFLSHDTRACDPQCKTCGYWTGLSPDIVERTAFLAGAKERIRRFQIPYKPFIHWSGVAKNSIRHKVEALYRDCQIFATNEIEKLTRQVEKNFPEIR